VKSAHDCSEGGLAVALAESCISGSKGAHIELIDQDKSRNLLLFGEGTARIIVSIDPLFRKDWEDILLRELEQNWQYLGQVAEEDLTIQVKNEKLINLTVKQLSSTWSDAIPSRL